LVGYEGYEALIAMMNSNWNVTGNDWEADVQKATATVTLPKGTIEKQLVLKDIPDTPISATSLNIIQQPLPLQQQETYHQTQGLTIVVGYTQRHGANFDRSSTKENFR